MKKKTVLSVYLFLGYLLLPILTIVMINHIDTSDTLAKMQTGYFGQHQSSIVVKSQNISMHEISTIANNISKDIAIYQDVPNMKNTKKIYFNNSFANIPMIQGRFFNKNDFKSNNMIAVVGKDYKHSLTKINDKNYISIDNKQIEVIGVMGISSTTNFDSYIFINGLVDTPTSKESIFTLDVFAGNGQETTNKVSEELNSYFNVNPQIISQQNASFSNFLPDVLYARWFILILMCNLLCIVLISLEWRNVRKREVNIYRLLGIKPFDIVINITSEYYILAFVSLITSLIFIIPFNAYYMNYIFYAMCSLIPIVIIFAIFMVISLLHSSIAEEIK